jgi:hypothetical protein
MTQESIYEDWGPDLQSGDIVYIKCEVLEEVTPECGVRVRNFPRRGKNEHSAMMIAPIFLKRPKSRIMKWVCNYVLRWF